MKGKHCILLLLILVALMSCNDPKPVTETLHRAEALMNEYPDSAWTLLNTISPDEMGQNRNRSLYALLYTQAQDKTYRDETNDSLISVAVDYYRDTDDVHYKFLSYYYKGRVHFNGKDYLNATTCYMEAEQLAEEVGDDYLVGLLYAELGRIYDIYYDYPKSLDAYQKAAECYELVGKIRHRNYMWLNQGDVCRNMGQNAESERLLQMALVSAQKEGDSTLIKSCMGSLVMMYIEEKQMQKAQELYAELESMADSHYGSASFMGEIARLHISKGEFSEALTFIEQGWECAEERVDSVNLYISFSELLARQGKNDLAYQELLKGVVLQNKEAKQALQQPVLTVQRDYLSERLEFEAYKLRMRKLLNLVSILFFLLLLGVAVYVFVRVLKKQKKASRQVIDYLEGEKKKVEDEKDRITSTLQKLDADKKQADQTVVKLKEEISRKEKEGNAKISDLVQKLGQGENTIEELKEELAQKEESRQNMETLVQHLENESKANSDSILALREDLKRREDEYRLSVEDAENIQKTLRSEIHRKRIFVSMFFKNWFEVMGMWSFFCEDKSEKGIKKIRKEAALMKEKYMEGNRAFRELEKLVNTYLDDVMLHFRAEVSLPDESDYRRTCYFFAGFSVQTIAWLMNENVKNVYQRRLRLRKMIESSALVHKELYLLVLAN